MKAKPVKLIEGNGYVGCKIEEATHVTIKIPGPTGTLTMPFILHGTRDGTNCWTWNADTEKPTLKPSILTTGHDFRCHIFANDGQAIFLSDCSHEHSGKTLDLIDVE